MKLKHITYAVAASLLLSGCFTGVESTPRISESDVKREKATVSKPEDSYLDGVASEPVANWKPGKKWRVTDSKIRLIFDAGQESSSVSDGDTLTLAALTETVSVTGDRLAVVNFLTSSGAQLSYRTSLSPTVLAKSGSFDIPHAVELSVVEQVRDRMLGNVYWIITPSRYDMAGSSTTGRRFVPVTVMAVDAGNEYYPVLLTMRDNSTGDMFRLYMSPDSSSRLPRRFSALFSLSDPRLRHPQISDDTWQLIINGKVAENMTREECRLALGSPSTINRQPGYSYMREMWVYENGIYLIFEDGLLRSFRQ